MQILNALSHRSRINAEPVAMSAIIIFIDLPVCADIRLQRWTKNHSRNTLTPEIHSACDLYLLGSLFHFATTSLDQVPVGVPGRLDRELRVNCGHSDLSGVSQSQGSTIRVHVSRCVQIRVFIFPCGEETL